MLRRHAGHPGLSENFTILDSDDQVRLLRQVMEAARVDVKRWVPQALWGRSSAGRIAADPGPHHPGRGHRFRRWACPRPVCRLPGTPGALNAADFGDLLLYVTELLRTQPDILQQYYRVFRYLPVDEYQDTNLIQYLWLRLLAQSHRNICPSVGDDDQCLAAGTQVTMADGRVSAAQLGARAAMTMGRRVEGFVAAVASIQSAFWFRCMPDGTCDVDQRVGNQAIRPPIFLQEHRARCGMNRGVTRRHGCGSLCANGTRSPRRLLPAGARAFVAFYTVIARGAATRQSPASKGRPERIEVAASHRSLQ
jgi:hypothetical protein